MDMIFGIGLSCFMYGVAVSIEYYLNYCIGELYG